MMMTGKIYPFCSILNPAAAKMSYFLAFVRAEILEVLLFLLNGLVGKRSLTPPASSRIITSPNPTAAEGSDGQPMMVTVPGGLSPGMSFEAGQGRAEALLTQGVGW